MSPQAITYVASLNGSYDLAGLAELHLISQKFYNMLDSMKVAGRKPVASQSQFPHRSDSGTGAMIMTLPGISAVQPHSSG